MRISFLRNCFDFVREGMPATLYIRVTNMANSVRRKRHRISSTDEEGILIADDGTSRIHYCRRGRGNRYKHGVMRRVLELAKEYHLDTIDVVSGGVLMDCGANIGELGLWARSRGLAYIPFEPEPMEARCCDLNNFMGLEETRRAALWKENTTLAFHSKPDSADSSVLAVNNYVSRLDVAATKLDGSVDLSGIHGTVIFKVEAEGAEPEVLEGATMTLREVDWVAIDCGYERGEQRAHTFIETNRILYDHGFRPRRANFRRITMLFENTRR